LIYQEGDLEKHIPELCNISDIVLSLDILEYNTYRIIALGCQNGNIYLLIYNYQDQSISKHSKHLDGPIPSVKLFQSFLTKQLNLVIGAAIGYSIMFVDVLTSQFQQPQILEKSDKHDSILIVETRIVNNYLEIILGTYGQYLLAYKEKILNEKTVYDLSWTLLLPHPIYKIYCGNITNRGLDEMVVSTMYGINILQTKKLFRRRNKKETFTNNRNRKFI